MGDTQELVDRIINSLPPSFEFVQLIQTKSGFAIQLVWNHTARTGSWFTTGFFPTLESAVDFTTRIFENITERDILKLLDNAKLFPNIKGIMLKDADMILTLSGQVKEIKPDAQDKGSGRTRLELYFSDSRKTAIINANQLLKIIALYGDDTDNWRGKRVALYGEHGKWFGKATWAIRVRDKAPAAVKKAPPVKVAPVDPRQMAIDKGGDFINAAVEGMDFESAAAVKVALKELGMTSIPGEGKGKERGEIWDQLLALQPMKNDEEE